MKLIYKEELESTQRYSKELLKNGERNFVVMAERQSFGNGRRGRKWISPNGGLWFSFICEKSEQLPDELVYFSTLAIGVATKKAIESYYNCELKIKWPNDILLNNKKICGIICEKVEDYLVFGIGVNTNFLKAELEKYSILATSLMSETGKIIDNRLLMQEIVEEANQLLKMPKGDIVSELNRYLAYKGENHYITYLNGMAEIIEVDENGNLIVFDSGERKRILAGEII